MMETRSSTRFGPISASVEVALFLLIAGSATAHAGELQGTLKLAYIDPGSGSFIIQIVVALLAAVTVTTRIYWTRIKSWLGMASEKQADNGDLAPSASPETPPNDD